MDSSLILANVLTPPILFFFIGLTAVLVKSDLEIPQPIPKLFSLYLLLSIGFKGGHELHESGLTLEVASALIAAVVMAAVVPIYSYFILRLTHGSLKNTGEKQIDIAIMRSGDFEV